jgi:integrase/recombinase XerD
MRPYVLDPFIDSFVREKKISGYSFQVQERWMRQFKAYYNESSSDSKHGTLKLMEGFYTSNPGESIATKQKRQCLMRQFAIYLNKHGIVTPLPEPPDKYFSYPKRVPYIFTKQELAAIFRQIDCWKTTPYSRGNSAIMDPLIFRMAYGCGMRIMEILTLRCADVDSDASTIHIRHGKNGRERRIPMAASLAHRCLKYKKSMHIGNKDERYFFPGSKKNGHASHEAACRRFKEYLWKAGIVRTDKGPVIHDLRHSYCVHRLKDWTLSGADISSLLPYMSAFLGHADFRGTEYYLRLTADLYPEIVKKMEELYGSIIPTRLDVLLPARLCGKGGEQNAKS